MMNILLQILDEGKINDAQGPHGGFLQHRHLHDLQRRQHRPHRRDRLQQDAGADQRQQEHEGVAGVSAAGIPRPRGRDHHLPPAESGRPGKDRQPDAGRIPPRHAGPRRRSAGHPRRPSRPSWTRPAPSLAPASCAAPSARRVEDPHRPGADRGPAGARAPARTPSRWTPAGTASRCCACRNAHDPRLPAFCGKGDPL